MQKVSNYIVAGFNLRCDKGTVCLWESGAETHHLRLLVEPQTRVLVAGEAVLVAAEAVVEQIVGEGQHSGNYTILNCIYRSDYLLLLLNLSIWAVS